MYLKNLWHIFKDAVRSSDQHNIFKLSASLGFYSLFALGPLFLVIIFVTNIFWGKQAIEGKIYSQVSSFIGDTPAHEIQELIKNATISTNNILSIIGIIALLIAATTIFTDMQESLNTIWNLRVKREWTWQQILKNRLLSFAIVTGLGFLLLALLVFDSLLESVMDGLGSISPKVSIIVVYIINLGITMLVVAFFFSFVYKVMPDAMIHWKEVRAGSFFSAVLFMAGKFGVTFYINLMNTNDTYTSAGAIVVLMLWIYYSAMILYFGAEFTKAYALRYGAVIRIKEWAVTTEASLEETNEPSVQENEKFNAEHDNKALP